MYQSIPSLTIPPPPREIFLMGEFPTPQAYKKELKPRPPGAFSSIIYYKNVKKWDKSCKTARLSVDD